MIRFILALCCTLSVTLTGLTACTSLSSHFDCPQTAGVRCQSLDQINHAIDQGLLAALRKEGVILC
jgi:hypothetical protein